MNIYFIGIGGIGLSALARYYLAQGHQVTGSDLEQSEITDALQKEGIEVYIKHDPSNIPSDVDRVIYTAAVNDDNEELKEAKRKEITTQSYAEALGELTKEHFTIAITGTHGKSTTAAMVASILIEADLDPTVILGTKFDQLEHENCRIGESNYLVIEADEFDRSFLEHYPEILTVTNIEEDHLDCYENLENIINAYREFTTHLPKHGELIINGDDHNAKKLKHKRTQTFSLQNPESEKIKNILQIPGKHNVANALAALQTARALDIPDEVSFKALSGFKGVWRRFDIKERKLKGKKITVINDYAHHPTEVKATLEAADEKFPEQKKWAVFQPHQAARTTNLFDEFVKTLKEVTIDKLIVTDIYKVAGREEKKKITSKELVNAINQENVVYVPKEKLKDFLSKNLEGQLLTILGAGDIYKLEQELTKE
ncbi:MAG: Mur ligase domain-containing protein [Candidatus Paceibacterota bacterium]